MAYRIEIGAKADRQLAKLDVAIGASIERKIGWLGQNAESKVYRVAHRAEVYSDF
jgi:mRNA-degrading endonuclease RelE of RelBE toxin-antitoxin system